VLPRLVLVAAIATLFTSLHFLGFFDLIGDAAAVRDIFARLGLFGPILYVVSFALLEPFFVPGVAFIIPGAVLWPFPTLFALSWLGSVGAGVVGFGFARYLGREYVERHLPRRFHRYDERLATAGLRTVIVIRMTFFLAPPAHWLLGLSSVSFGTFLLGTAIGFLPGIFLLSYVIEFAGGTLIEWLRSQPVEVWLTLGLLIAGGVVLRRWARRRADRQA